MLLLLDYIQSDTIFRLWIQDVTIFRLWIQDVTIFRLWIQDVTISRQRIQDVTIFRLWIQAITKAQSDKALPTPRYSRKNRTKEDALKEESVEQNKRQKKM